MISDPLPSIDEPYRLLLEWNLVKQMSIEDLKALGKLAKTGVSSMRFTALIWRLSARPTNSTQTYLDDS